MPDRLPPLRPLLTLLASLGLAAALAGCLTRGQASDQTQVRFCFFGGYEEWQLWQGLAKDFEAENPDIRMKLHYWPGTYEDKLKLTFAAGTAPDVISAQDEPVPAYVARNQYQDLTDFVARDPDFYSQDKYFQTALTTFQIDGRQWAIPWNGGAIMMYFNRGLFRELGLGDPNPEWTVDEFIEVCKALTGDDDGDGRIDHFAYEMSANWMYSLIPWVWIFGGDILNAEMTRCTLDEPEALAGLQFLHDLRYRWHVSPQPGEMGAGTGGGVMFMTGRLGLQINGPWNLPFMRKTDLDWDVTHMPTGPGGQYTRGTWDALAMYSNTQHPEEAWRFIKFATGPVGQARVAATGRAIPPRKAQAYDDGFIRPDTPQNEMVFLDGMRYFRTQRIPVRWAEMDTVLKREFEKMLLPSGSVEESAAAMVRDINEILAARR